MKRTLLAVLLAVGLPLLAAVPSSADAAPKGSGPACAQFHDGQPVYTTASHTIPATFAVTLDLAAPSCKNVVYSINAYATTANGGGHIVTTSQHGDGVSQSLTLQVQVPGGPSAICGTGTTNSDDGRAFDIVPGKTDNGCPVGGMLLLDGGSGGGFWGS